MDAKEESDIKLLIGEAVMRAQDRQEARGGDIKELERLLQTAPNSMETVAAIDLLYRRHFWWEKLLGRRLRSSVRRPR
jgi:hypothetical protein